MSYTFFVVPKTEEQLRIDIFLRMQNEKLLPSCMHSIKNPSCEDWLNLTNPHKGWLLCCVKNDATSHHISQLCGIAWIEPWQGQVWTFDFTVFRAHFSKAVHMSNAALHWIFDNAPCKSIIGLCAKSNRHAWRLANAAGFSVLGHIPNACFQARQNKYEDAVFVLATKETLVQKHTI